MNGLDIGKNNPLFPYQTIEEETRSELTIINFSKRKITYLSCFLLFTFGLIVFIGVRIKPHALMSSLSTPNLNNGNNKITPFKEQLHPEPPTAFWGVVSKPYPTGAFWTNLAVKDGRGAVGVYPYGVKTIETGVHVSYGAARRIVSKKSISDIFVTDLQISATQGYVSRSIEAYDHLSVTMGFKTNNNGKFKVHLVKSSPFITVTFENATPIISSPLMQILSVESRVVKESVGVQYVVTLGNFEQWLVYCSEPIALVWSGNTLLSSVPIKGFVRVAILPRQNMEKSFNLLLNYVKKYPVGAKTTISYTDNTAVVAYEYTTVGTGPLLMLMLPHHESVLLEPEISEEVKNLQMYYTPVWCIKGKMKPIIGEEWKLHYDLTPINWSYDVNEKLSTEKLDQIAYSLLQDVTLIPPSAVDPYGFGKEIGRMARLALIADNLGVVEARQQALNALKAGIQPWLQGSNVNGFVYDKVYGGLVSSNGLMDAQADFGNGWYNDHHFHYGYFLNAGATLARLDPEFFNQYKSAFDSIVKDICNWDSNDQDFPYARHKDFFDGHSWASGLFSQANGKGQESSSEAINAYYGAYLYGLATSNKELSNFAHTLLVMEIQATKMYWHMSDDRIYDALFSASRMVGNMGSLDVTSSTWFGDQPEYVHGINIMPLSPATAALLDTKYVQIQYPVLESRVPHSEENEKKNEIKTPSKECSANPGCVELGLSGNCCPSDEGGIMLSCCEGQAAAKPRSGLDPQWESYIYIDQAVIDRDSAWEELIKMNDFGPGNSKSNSLFWAASRAASVGTPPAVKEISDKKLIKSNCSANSACDAQGIEGECCPVTGGTYLMCCPVLTN